MNTGKSAKQIADEHDASFNAHDLKAHSDIVAEDVEFSMPGDVVLRGREQVIAMAQLYWEAFPDVKVTPTNRIVADPYVVEEGMINGTHNGNFRTPNGDIPATGKPIEIRFVTVKRIVNEKVASEHLYFDQIEFLTQLGLMPSPGGR